MATVWRNHTYLFSSLRRSLSAILCAGSCRNLAIFMANWFRAKDAGERSGIFFASSGFYISFSFFTGANKCVRNGHHVFFFFVRSFILFLLLLEFTVEYWVEVVEICVNKLMCASNSNPFTYRLNDRMLSTRVYNLLSIWWSVWFRCAMRQYYKHGVWPLIGVTESVTEWKKKKSKSWNKKQMKK